MAVASREPLIQVSRSSEEILTDARSFTQIQEGFEAAPYHPTSSSGVTIGYGYDMRDKSSAEIRRDLVAVVPSVEPDWILRLGAAAGLSGSEADSFVAAASDIVLDTDQAESLFSETYLHEADAARDFATNPQTYERFVVTYPAADWDVLHPAVRGMLIDLKYRGDYRPWWSEQELLQASIVANDPGAMLIELRRAEIFPDDLIELAPARYEARIEWMEQAIDGLRTVGS
jgi:hypothetical protein